MPSTSVPLTIGPAPALRRADAIALVFRHLSESERAALIGNVVAGLGTTDAAAQGILEARRGDRLVGAVWAQLQPGAVAVVWPPGLEIGEPNSTVDELLVAANKFLMRRRVSMAQTLLEHADSEVARSLLLAGFTHFADLLYMASTSVRFPRLPPSSRLTYLPYSSILEERLKSVVEESYVDTLDCPALNGVRKMADVIAGYQATGVFRPENWRLVADGERDVACLLLADHPTADHIELVYMGVVPAARGQGIGQELTRYAQWLTHCAGRSRLVLAVDAKNRFAIDAYQAAGFFAWEKRAVFLRTFLDENSSDAIPLDGD